MLLWSLPSKDVILRPVQCSLVMLSLLLSLECLFKRLLSHYVYAFLHLL